MNKTIPAVGAVILLVAFGCAAPTPTSEQDNSSDVTGTKKPKGSDPGTPEGGGTSSTPGNNGGSTSSSSSGTGGAPPAGGACGAKTTQDACYDCCETSTPEISAAAKAEAVIDKEWQTCACAAARCGTACATDYCAAGADPTDDASDATCQACLDSTKTDLCDDQTDAKYEALEATPGYVAWEKCDADSQCASKPE